MTQTFQNKWTQKLCSQKFNCLFVLPKCEICGFDESHTRKQDKDRKKHWPKTYFKTIDLTWVCGKFSCPLSWLDLIKFSFFWTLFVRSCQNVVLSIPFPMLSILFIFTLFIGISIVAPSLNRMEKENVFIFILSCSQNYRWNLIRTCDLR